MTEEQTTAQEAEPKAPDAPQPRSMGAVWGIIAASFAIMLVLCVGGATLMASFMGPNEAAVNSEVQAESPDATSEGEAQTDAASADATADLSAVAATINGQTITEQTIADYIADFRQEMDLTTDEAWGEWLATYGYTPEDMRQDVIDSFIYENLYSLAAEEFNLEVTQDDIDEALAELKSMYESDEEYQADLEAYGYTEETYVNESLVPMLLEEKIMEMAAGGQEDEDGSIFMAWLENYKELKGVSINPMPEGLPYDIDMTAYESAAADDGLTLDGSDLTVEGEDGAESDIVYLDENGEEIDLSELEFEDEGDDASADGDDAATLDLDDPDAEIEE
ncbi:SurA N-terminal domain-containing protein [uncultured Adlercreutzia sp.]|uniref:SurA N-terminal domain-containing protein n=1 Tax=uncultured Adlercreutzia sp. TaxID=875803 RepID=UPI00262F68C3|nr:SurA N-terminal domain-containing protein [uncultured Adlercreutzia sp.]MCI9262626.1 hypothetical protein [Eggerthellaceae bacterium]